jgi:hypothetical protein
MGTVYTVTELLALRGSNAAKYKPFIGLEKHEKSNLVVTYLAMFRKYTKLLTDGPEAFRNQYRSDSRIVLKYDFALSNKEFKRRWVKSHGTSAGLKDQRRIPVRVFSLRVRFLEEYFRAVKRVEKSLSRLLNRIGFRPYQDVAVKPPSKLVSPVGKSKNPPFKRDRRAVKLSVHSGPHGQESYFRVIGGLTYVYKPYEPPPEPRWKKYWYYFRKRGSWRPSEHHPYGDEISRIDHFYEEGFRG